MGQIDIIWAKYGPNLGQIWAKSGPNGQFWKIETRDFRSQYVSESNHHCQITWAYTSDKMGQDWAKLGQNWAKLLGQIGQKIQMQKEYLLWL